MRIGYIGATGGVGKHALEYALERGHSVKALVRSPEKMSAYEGNPNVELLKGNSTNKDDMIKLFDAVDIVLCSVGASPGIFIMEDTAKAVLAAAEAHPPKKIMFITSLGMGGSSKVVNFVLGLVVGRANIEDTDRADALLQTLKVPYTVIRPTELGDSNPKGAYNATLKGGMGFGALDKKDVALFMIDHIDKDDYVNKCVQLYQKK